MLLFQLTGLPHQFSKPSCGPKSTYNQKYFLYILNTRLNFTDTHISSTQFGGVYQRPNIFPKTVPTIVHYMYGVRRNSRLLLMYCTLTQYIFISISAVLNDTEKYGRFYACTRIRTVRARMSYELNVEAIGTRTLNFRVSRFAGLSIPALQGQEIEFISCSVFICIIALFIAL